MTTDSLNKKKKKFSYNLKNKIKDLNMETPILNKKQLKSTLSAKKSRPKEIIKNVLASPYDNYYWPQISDEDNETLRQKLNVSLPRIKIDKINVPWKEVKNVPKEERRKLRAEYLKNNTSEVQCDQTANEKIVIGVNDVTKLLEKNLAEAVLIASDVQPKFMVQHLIDLAVLNKIPVLIVTDLRKTVKNHSGVSGAALALKKDLKTDTKLWLTLQTIKEIHSKYPFPTNHINYDRKIFPQTEKIVPKKHEIDKKNIVSDEEIKSKVYLKRGSNKVRVFVPELSAPPKKLRTDRMELDSTGFLSFSAEEPKKVTKKTVGSSSYKALIVKRLKGNSQRSKQKIEQLKRKKK